jgi:hypothetical protein
MKGESQTFKVAADLGLDITELCVKGFLPSIGESDLYLRTHSVFI